jgi:SPP1 family predicted phage head-tail adaptor
MESVSAVHPSIANTMRLKGTRPNYLSAELLHEPIGVLQPTQVSDGEGGYTVTYQNTATIWGMFIPVGDSRSLIAAQVSYTASATVFVRYPLTIDQAYRLEIGGEQYSIHSITNVENKDEYLEIQIFK